ncbi:DUF6585 family protein [Micromonospora sp. NBRC 101691]|uniref:DUF6585 family protein n=1 Tax=Micromonospora sp. NBRC 101691 TaxID=3032198 RepID=UPI0025525CDE|nr:DUF6585 family protein [Micromonospora sp. NBRC 101691]
MDLSVRDPPEFQVNDNGARPGDPAAVPGGGQDLGAPVMTAAPRRSLFGRRWRGAELHLFTGGLRVTAPDGFGRSYRWESVRVLQNHTRVNGGLVEAVYTLIDGDGTALSLGPGHHGLLGRHLQRVGVTSVTWGPVFVDPMRWGPEIQRRVTAAQLPAALARLNAGERLTFGDITVDRHTVSVKEKTCRWADLDEIRLVHGQVYFEKGAGRHVLPAVVSAGVPNLYVFLGLADQLR